MQPLWWTVWRFLKKIKHRTSINSVQFSRSVMSKSLWPHGLQHTKPPCPSPTPGASSNSCPSSRWCLPPSCPLLSPYSPALSLSQHQGLFQWGSSLHQVDKVLGVSASVSVLPRNIQDWFPLELTGCFPCSPRDSQVFSIATVQKHQFFGAQLSLWSNSHIHIWLLEEP